MAVRLRYLAHDLEVPMGHFVIGRSADCQLSLEDPLVSRRHALLGVGPEGVFVEDLGSRNGVFVNGVRIQARTALGNGDRLTVGTQEMVLCIAPDAEDDAARIATLAGPLGPTLRPDPPPTSAPFGPTVAPSAARSEPAQPERPAPRDLGQDAPPTMEARMPVGTLESPDRRVNALTLIGGVADKALAAGRADEASRILYRSLVDVIAKAREGEAVSEGLAETAALYAARLGGATGRGEWVDYVFELYTVTDRVMPIQIVDELFAVLRRVDTVDAGAVSAYADRLHLRSPELGPAERFVQQRIEGLERLVAMK